MMLGTQWYILFNVIAGASAFPTDLREAATHVPPARAGSGGARSSCPGIFPYYVTGALTASGGSWNASIVAEVASWGDTKLEAAGLGAYIAQATAAGDYPRVVLGIAVMSVFVVAVQSPALAAALSPRRTPLAPGLRRSPPWSPHRRASRCSRSTRRAPALSARAASDELLVLDDVTLTLREGEIVGAARPLGLRQVHAAAHHRRPACRPSGGEVSIGGRTVAGPAARRRHGVPDLRAVSLADRAGECRARPRGAERRRRPSATSARWPRST